MSVWRDTVFDKIYSSMKTVARRATKIRNQYWTGSLIKNHFRKPILISTTKAYFKMTSVFHPVITFL